MNDGSGRRQRPGTGRARQPRRAPAGLPARRAALAAIRAVDEDDAWSNLAVPRAIEDLPEARDRAFAAHLAYDTLRWRGTLDWLLSSAVTRPLDEVEGGVLRVLRVGALQLLRTEVPARAVVDTSAALAREQVPRARGDGAAGFVNGVLRGLDRSLPELPWPDPDSDPVQHLVLTTAHPSWVVLDLLDRFGFERTRSVLIADNEPPGLTLRATMDRGELVAELRAQGLDARLGGVAEAVRVPGADPRRLAAVAEGRAVPQDEASMRVVHAVGAGDGEHVLDLCAGPGGKTTHLAARVGPTGSVTAVELHEHRAALIREAAARQEVPVEVLVGDATSPPLPAEASFSHVLLDAPCTGLGTGRRRPEVRWRRTPEDVQTLAELQGQLLASAARLVAPGGSLTYAVCTWTHAETDGLVAASAASIAAAGLRPTGREQLLPDQEDTDGMFIATWRRDHEA